MCSWRNATARSSASPRSCRGLMEMQSSMRCSSSRASGKAGVGRLLVDHCADVARGRSSRILHVVGNPHAEGFYAACRFRTTEPSRLDSARGSQCSERCESVTSLRRAGSLTAVGPDRHAERSDLSGAWTAALTRESHTGAFGLQLVQQAHDVVGRQLDQDRASSWRARRRAGRLERSSSPRPAAAPGLLSSCFVTTPSASALVNESSFCDRSWMSGCSALSSNQLVRAMVVSSRLQIASERSQLLERGEPRLQLARGRLRRPSSRGSPAAGTGGRCTRGSRRSPAARARAPASTA